MSLASETVAQPRSVIVFPQCSVTGDSTTQGVLLIKAGLTPTELDVCCLINNVQSESFTGRISTFNVIQGGESSAVSIRYFSGHSWEEFTQYLFAQVHESDIKLSTTEIGDTKMVTLSIKDWIDYVHLYNGPVIDATPYLIQAIESGVVAGRKEIKKDEVDERPSEMDIIKRGAFRLAKEKIRKAKQLEMILEVGKERGGEEALSNRGKMANEDRGGEPLTYIETHTPMTFPSGSGSYPSRKRSRAVVRKAPKGSPNAVPPRASDMITPMQPRRLEITQEKNENVPIKTMLPPPPIVNQYEKVSLKAFKEAKQANKASIPATDALPAPPLVQEGPASNRNFPYMHCYDNTIANVSKAKFPYMTVPPCVGVVAGMSFPYLYRKYNDVEEVTTKSFPYIFNTVNDGAVVCSSTFPYLYNVEGFEAVRVDTASYPYVYDDDTPRPISEAQRNRNRRSFRSFIRGQQQ